MQNEVPADILQSVIQYYKSKCSQLEHEFLLHKLESEKRIGELQRLINENASANSKE